MSEKMSRQDLKDLFPSYEPQKFQPSSATRRGFVHAHKPTWKPPKSKLTPAQWHRMKRGKPAPYRYQPKEKA